jgi:fucose permease
MNFKAPLRIWPSFLIICFTCILTGAAWTIVPAISNFLVASSNSTLSYQEYGYISSLLVIAAFLASQAAGEIGRFIGMKTIFITGLIFVFLSMIILFSSHYSTSKFGPLLCSQICLGFGIGIILTSLSAYLTFLTPKKIALALTGTYSCVNLGSFLYPTMLKIFNHTSLWWIDSLYISFFFIILILFSIMLLPNLKNPFSIAHAELFYILLKVPKHFWLFVIAIILYSINEISFSSWLPLFLDEEKEFSFLKSDQSLGIYWGAVTLGQLSVFFSLFRISAKKIYRLLPFLLLLSFIGLILFKKDYLIFFSIIIGALGCSAFFSLTMNFAEKTFPEIAEIVSACIVGGYFIGSAIGNLIIGLLKQTAGLSLTNIYWCIAAMILFIIFINLYLTQKKAHQ